ncbi:hypothetical protein M2375_003736 [Comamonas sp. BIGb0152]|uniref:hypothetical protein n=1 Tax=Comamonas sp. BIGb0152 TaxID=2940601 RepID=UPI00216725A0|nr:hypothetical protein [Comamonas sp. BIGb0152]MCS4295493.1 hypothetical protein [Comamonas sp. BIGb0152]
MKYVCNFIYTNSSPDAVLLVLEPWGEEVLLASGGSAEVIGEGGLAGSAFELEQLDDRLIVYAWPDSVASISIL